MMPRWVLLNAPIPLGTHEIPRYHSDIGVLRPSLQGFSFRLVLRAFVVDLFSILGSAY
jgi:hypothetical protein